MNSGRSLVNLLNSGVEEQVSIYALWENEQIVYVGSAIDPWKRFASHTGAGGAYKNRNVSLEILTWVVASDRDKIERFAIKAGLRWGFPLENIVHGYGYERNRQ